MMMAVLIVDQVNFKTGGNMKRLFVLFFIGLLLLIKVPFVSASELSNNGSPYCPQYANVAYKPDLQKYQVC